MFVIGSTLVFIPTAGLGYGWVIPGPLCGVPLRMEMLGEDHAGQIQHDFVSTDVKSTKREKENIKKM